MYVDNITNIAAYAAIYADLPLFGQINLFDGSVQSMFKGSVSSVDVIDIFAFDSYYADVFILFSDGISFQAFSYSTTYMDVVTLHSSTASDYQYTAISGNSFGFLYLAASKTQTQKIFKLFFDDEGFREDYIPIGGSKSTLTLTSTPSTYSALNFTGNSSVTIESGVSYDSDVVYGTASTISEDLMYQEGNNFEISVQAETLTYLNFDFL